ncbi:MAG: amino acid ABC transporter substrate-binding protein [Cyanobacteria bacterium P01_A01_bin.40]
MLKKIAWKPKIYFSALICGLMLVNTTKHPVSQANATDQEIQPNLSTLDIVQERGYLICGVNGELPGFSFVNSDDRYEGIDVDFCRAIAAALFDDANQVKFRNVTAEERFAVLKSGEIDLLSRNTTKTLSRDTDSNLGFTPPIFYDAQGVMVKKASGIKKLADLENKSICVAEDTTSYDNLQDYMKQAAINFRIVASSDREVLFDSYEYDRCQGITTDISQLIARRTLLANPRDHQILAQTISQEPLAPMLRHQDSQWFDVVKWITFALIQAEEFGISSENIKVYRNTKELGIRRFLGLDNDLGSQLGLSNDFTLRIIEQVGNYGEIYERNIGQPFGLDRGENALWQNGGLMYSPPFN